MAYDVPLGCMNRPWGQFTFEDALAGIAAAGFTHFGFLAQQRRQLVAPDLPAEEVLAAGEQVRRHGLVPAMIPHSVAMDRSDEENIARLQRQIDHAVRLGVRFILEMGHGRPEHYERYFAIMCAAAPYAQARGVTIALKPHGGLSTTGEQCLEAVQRVDHPAYRLCFDPGNLLYYAGQRPEAVLPALAPYAVAMCVKDERGGVRGSVNVTPGDGEVDFPAVFRILKEHGFSGPCIVETLGGTTLEEVNQEAKRAYRYLTGLLASL